MIVRVILKLIVLTGSLFLLESCVPPAKAPMRTVFFSAANPPDDRVLLVFLPGKGDDPENYETEGFVKAVKRLDLPVDMIGADAHIGYYLKNNFPERLKEDVIMPAKSRGYKHIWLIGISLGGLGALWYDGIYPGDVEALVSIAPYLGEPEMGREVSMAGGLAFWKPSHESADDMQTRIWLGLKAYLSPDRTVSRVYLGYGLQDRFAGPDGVFAVVLPDSQVFTCEGGHDWDTWRQLWKEILKRLEKRWKAGKSDYKKEKQGNFPRFSCMTFKAQNQ